MAKIELIVPITAVPGKAQELRKHLAAMLAPTHSEPGCEFYRLYESENEGRFFFHELWSSSEALDAHAQSIHFKNLLKVTEGLLAVPLDINKVKELT